MILQNPLKTPLRRKRIKVRILKKEATKLIDMVSLGLTLFLKKWGQMPTDTVNYTINILLGLGRRESFWASFWIIMVPSRSHQTWQQATGWAGSDWQQATWWSGSGLGNIWLFMASHFSTAIVFTYFLFSSSFLPHSALSENLSFKLKKRVIFSDRAQSGIIFWLKPPIPPPIHPSTRLHRYDF